MSRKYKIQDQQKLYFVTFTVIDWIDVFIRDEYGTIIVDARPNVSCWEIQ